MRTTVIASGLVLAASIAAPAATAQPQADATAAPAGRDALVLVVPFANLSGDPADDWIGVGIAEAAAIDLQMGGARVVRAPARSDDPGAAGGLEAGRQAGADRVVNGAYQRLGDRIRVTARLVAVADGAVLRSATVTGRVSNIFELQDQVAAGLRAAAAPAGSAAAAGQEPALGMPLLSLSAGMSGLKACSSARSGTSGSLSLTVPKG